MTSSSENDILRYIWRELWVHDFNLSCVQHGAYVLARDLLDDPIKFRSFYRMCRDTHQELYHRLFPLLRKQDTKYRKAITADEKLLITLRYLVTGSSFRDLSFHFLRGETTIGKIVKDVCTAIWSALQPEFMPVPTKETWKRIFDRYLELWNIPDCIGSLDGKHIRIQCPSKSGSSFCSYKGYFSIVLLALADADSHFISVNVGECGRTSDGGGVLQSSALGRKLNNDQLHIPESTKLPDDKYRRAPFPFFFVGDVAFPLQKHLIRPYPRRELTNAKGICNYSLSRVRKIVECAFGMLASKSRVLKTTIACKPGTIYHIVRGTCVLHNSIKLKDGKVTEPSLGNENSCGVPDTSFDNPHNLQPCCRRVTTEAEELRNRLWAYFLKLNVALPWQNKYSFT